MTQSVLGRIQQKLRKLLSYSVLLKLPSQANYLNLVVSSNGLDDIFQLGNFICWAIFIGRFFNLNN